MYKGGHLGASIQLLVFKDSLGFLFLYSMSRCVDCNHPNNASSHDRCRGHADCARGGKYYAGFCGICHDLWGRARNYKEDPHDAKEAFDLLLPWVLGFGKNSRGRPTGEDFFEDVEEKLEFKFLKSIHKPRKRASSLDTTMTSIPSQRVSMIFPNGSKYVH